MVITELPPPLPAATTVAALADAEAAVHVQRASVVGVKEGDVSRGEPVAGLADRLVDADLSVSDLPKAARGNGGGNGGGNGETVEARAQEGEGDAAFAARLQAEEHDAFVREQHVRST